MGGFLKHKTCDLFSLQLSQDQDRSGDFFILFLCVFIYFYLFFVGGVGVGGGGGGTSLSLAENSGHLTWVRHSSCKRAALAIPVSVCSVFLCPNNGMAASVGDF